MRRRKLLSGAAALAGYASLVGDARANIIAPQPSRVLAGSATIQAFGDSISSSSNGLYFPTETNISNIPSWLTGTIYPAGRVVKNAGLVFYTVAGGTAGVTPPTPAGLNDGGVTWVWNECVAQKLLSGYLTWAEIFSQGRLRWDMSAGYAGVAFGLLGVNVWAGGSGYVTPVASFNNGATGTVQTAGGAVTGVTILSPGFGGGICTITDAGGGTGVGTTAFQGGWGSLGVPGENTGQMLLRLKDAVVCNADIMVVHAGTNDVSGGGDPSVTIANLKTIYEAIIRSGKRVVAAPITPGTSLSTVVKAANAARINRWIRAYVRGEAWANPAGFRAIALADVSGFYEDGAVNTSFAPVGGLGGVAGAMTQDGTHPSQRSAAYWGYVLWQACQGWVGAAPDKTGPIYSAIDGYDPTYNPGGNMLEGLTWQALTPIALGALVTNANGDTYWCSTAGTTSAATPPVGGGASITDGSVVWSYTGFPRGRSNLSAGTTGAQIAATGIVYSGSLCKGMQIGRTLGTAAGTVACAIESPWSNGQIGQRQSVVFTLGSGTANEQWFILGGSANNANWGLQPGDLGAASIYAEAEIELSGIANCSGVVLQLLGDRMLAQTGANQTGVGAHMLNSAGEMIALPNSGKMLLRTQPMLLHPLNTTLTLYLKAYFDAPGGAGSSTLTVKMNYIGMRRAGVA